MSSPRVGGVALRPQRKRWRCPRLIATFDGKVAKRWWSRARLLFIVGASLVLWFLIALAVIAAITVMRYHR